MTKNSLMAISGTRFGAALKMKVESNIYPYPDAGHQAYAAKWERGHSELEVNTGLKI
jgi:hypothetical protein